MARVYSSMGLFGSQGRPGMRSSSSLGSLSGSSLGDATTPAEPVPVATALPSVPTTVTMIPVTTKNTLLAAGALLAAWYVFFKK